MSKWGGERQIPCDFTCILNLNKKNKQYKQKQTYKCADTENRLVVTTREEGKSLGVGERVKGVNCMVMDHNKTCRAKHSMVYTDVEL